MPCLKYIIQNANKEELKLLRGKTIECVSLIGLAVGPEKFMRDASEVMDLLLKTHTEVQLPDDDPQTSYLISAWARICKILGEVLLIYMFIRFGHFWHNHLSFVFRKRFPTIFTVGDGPCNENSFDETRSSAFR